MIVLACVKCLIHLLDKGEKVGPGSTQSGSAGHVVFDGQSYCFGHFYRELTARGMG